MHMLSFRANSADDAIAEARRQLVAAEVGETEANLATENLRRHLQAFGDLPTGEQFEVHMNGSVLSQGDVMLSCGHGCAVTRRRLVNTAPLDAPTDYAPGDVAESQTIGSGEVGNIPTDLDL